MDRERVQSRHRDEKVKNVEKIKRMNLTKVPTQSNSVVPSWSNTQQQTTTLPIL